MSHLNPAVDSRGAFVSCRIASGPVARKTASEIDRGEFFSSYYRASPVVVAGSRSCVTAAEQWSPEYLSKRIGSKPVVVVANERGLFDYNSASGLGEIHRLQMGFDEALRKVRSEEGMPHYIQQHSIEYLCKGLLKEAPLPYLLDQTIRVTATNLWIGAKGCKSPLHYDPRDNFLVQLEGRKRVILFHPDETESLYPALGEKLPNCSRVNVFCPEPAKFPLFVGAASRARQCEIGPGDFLYIPHRWWHAVESLSMSISANSWWLADRNFKKPV